VCRVCVVQDSLAELMSTIEKTSPHYVRCIKPNHQKRQGIFEKPKVLEQLRCGGVLESVLRHTPPPPPRKPAGARPARRCDVCVMI
jgi:hypothetical protein